MINFIQENWTQIIALLGAGIGIWKYLDARNNELNWKKTEFIFEQAQYLDNDLDVIKAIKVISGNEPGITIDEIFGEGYDQEIRTKYIIGFEKIFNLLDRLSHAFYTLKTLNKAGIRNFSWYLREIENNSRLLKYCENNGYQDVIKLIQDI